MNVVLPAIPVIRKLNLIVLIIWLLSSCKGDGDKTREAVRSIPRWYSNALIYNLDVKAFKDSNGDGTGDFRGLTQKLGYLDSLGVDVIWLSPFQPSPGGDDGYDVTDYFGIDKKLGTLSDFQEFMKAAKARGLKVIMDVVLNHTSSAHEWFKQARADTTSKYYSWYVWSAKKPSDADKGMVFPGVQTETWTYEDATKKYYFHRFYDFEPDLNYERADVRRMAADVLIYWLKAGMNGFRLDAVPFIIDLPKTGSDKPEHNFAILSDLYKVVHKIDSQAVLLGEANVTAKENPDYFGEKGDRLQMMFNFYANQHLFYALAKQDPKPLISALEDFREKPANAQWAFFLRNHDEVDLARLGNLERKLVFKKFGPETNMQLYKRGIRRRLAPMLGDPALLRMSYSLLFSLPGAPVIRYGEEIGMGDDLTLNERLSVRTPMQWNASANGGFSGNKLPFRPVIGYGSYTYKKVNVEAQKTDSNSLLTFVKKITAVRKAHPEIGLGTWKIMDTGKESIMAIQYILDGKQLITVHNFSAGPKPFSLKTDLVKGSSAIELLGKTPRRLRTGSQDLILPGYGFQWYEIR